MIRNIALILIFGVGVGKASSLTLASGTNQTCIGLSTVTTTSPCEEDMPGFDQSGPGFNLTEATVQNDFVIPLANVTPLVNGGKWAAPQGDGATWISMINTGWDTATSAAVNTLPNVDCGEGLIVNGGACEPNGEFFLTFTTNATNPTLNLTVWADDSAEVLIASGFSPTSPGSLVYTGVTPIGGTTPDASAGQLPGPCAPPGFVNCLNPTDFTVNLPGPGTYTVEFDAYQIGGFSYGLMYDGTVTEGTALAPESSTWILLAAGLGLIAVRRVKRVR